MEEINLEKISKLLSEKLDKEIKITKIEPAGSGYHSDGFKISTEDGQSYFLKKVKSHDMGFETPEKKLASLLVSNDMALRSKFPPQPLGLILINKENQIILPEINEDTEIYHVQEFEEKSPSYWQMLGEKKKKNKVDEIDLKELNEVVKFITSIHKIKHPAKDADKLKTVYNDGLRSMIIHPELSFTLMRKNNDKHPFLPPQKQAEYIGLMLDIVYQWKDRYDRLGALHGDFWGANFFFKKDGTGWVIDYSRIPWGDPGIDIGWWTSQYLWHYHETGNKYFKELGEKFLEMYIEKTGDQEIRQTMSLTFGLMGIIYTTPDFYPEVNIKTVTSFFNNILDILQSKKFIWKK